MLGQSAADEDGRGTDYGDNSFSHGYGDRESEEDGIDEAEDNYDDEVDDGEGDEGDIDFSIGMAAMNLKN